MNEADYPDPDDEDGTKPGAIGVGMGGSCPTCRAPVDLGQEFCLECGSPIRFTGRQRRQAGRSSQLPATPAAAAAAPRRPGFPWVPFLIVLALVGGGVAFALLDGDSTPSNDRSDSTEPALPEITDSIPETTSQTQTTTLQDCDPAQPLSGTEPTVDGIDDDTSALDDAPLDGGLGEQIPEVTEDGANGPLDDAFAPDDPDDPAFDDQSVPSTEPDERDDATVTVDEDGNLCPSDQGGAPGGLDDPIVDPNQPGSDDTSTGTWPNGRAGWTVVVFGYDTRERATQGAADLQDDGFSDGGVLFSSDFRSLCPGFYVVYSGIFDSKAEAERRRRELQAKDYAGMYVREVRQDGSAATGCRPVAN